MEESKRLSEKDINRSLKLIVLAVTLSQAFFIVMGGAGLTGFVRMLGVNEFAYGAIMALPVVGGVAQLFMAYVLERSGKRKLLFLISGFIHRLLWIPIGLVPLFVPAEQQALRIGLIAVLIVISSAGNASLGVTFWSWIGDLVPSNTRGKYFSRRTMISTFSGMTMGLILAFFLDRVHDFTGFAAILFVVALLGAADIVVFFWVSDPPMQRVQESGNIFKMLGEPLRNKNYMRYIAFVAAWNFAINFSAPFFNVYMLEHLHLRYMTISLITQICSNIVTILTIIFWGMLVDKAGSKPIMKVCSLMMSFMPLMWLFTSPSSYWMIIANSILSGIVFPGFDMTASNQSVWLAPDRNRSSYIAVYTLTVSLIGIAFANLCGGAFMQVSKPFFNSLDLPFVMGQKFSNFHALFILTTLMRFTVRKFIMPLYKEEGSGSMREALKNVFNELKAKYRLFRRMP